MKKLLALLLAVMMVLSVSSAFAAGKVMLYSSMQEAHSGAMGHL